MVQRTTISTGRFSAPPPVFPGTTPSRTPSNPVYGLVNRYGRGPVFYGDDNARVLLSSLVCARLLENDRWDRPILRCLLAMRLLGETLFDTTPAGRFRKHLPDLLAEMELV